MSERSLQSSVIKQESKSGITALKVSEGFSLPTASIKSEPVAETFSVKCEPDCNSLPSPSENEQKFAVRSVKSEPEYSEQSSTAKYGFRTCYVKRAVAMESRPSPLAIDTEPCSSGNFLTPLESAWERFDSKLPPLEEMFGNPKQPEFQNCAVTSSDGTGDAPTTERGSAHTGPLSVDQLIAQLAGRASGDPGPGPSKSKNCASRVRKAKPMPFLRQTPNPEETESIVDSRSWPHNASLQELLNTLDEGLRTQLTQRFRAAHLEMIQHCLLQGPPGLPANLNLVPPLVSARASSLSPPFSSRLPKLDKVVVQAMINEKQCPICRLKFEALVVWACSACRSYGYRTKSSPPEQWPVCNHSVSQGKGCLACRFTVFRQAEEMFVDPTPRRPRRNRK